jgi:hypothetical protein
MCPLDVGYDRVVTERKSSSSYANPDKQVTRQLDELERISQQERDKHLGKEYFTEIKKFYDIEDTRPQLNFRPAVNIPQLQTLVLNEATDITDASIKVYITQEGKRDENREKYYQANWRQGCYNNRILEAIIWAMLSNLGFLQIGFSPSARRGKGKTWLEARDPELVHPDPFCRSDSDWSWVQWDDWLYIDEVRRRWPEKGYLIKAKTYAGSADPYGSADTTLDFPAYSPMSNQGTEPEKKIFRDNRVRVRTTFLFDNTREKVTAYAGSNTEASGLVHPRFGYKYPDGRWLTDCEDIVLADGNNWCPQLPDDDRGTFPLVRIAAMPTITSFWGPPPVKLSKSLQELSERLYTQMFENVVRTNNNIIVIEENTGLDISSVGWIPGEMLMIRTGSKPPMPIPVPALPQHMVTLPAALLALQKELQGFSDSRQGQSASGNVSSDLFDATLWQSHYQTRLRGRLLSESLQRLAQIVWYVDARYKNIADRVFVPNAGKDESETAEWSPIDQGSLDQYDAYLDPGSLQIVSGGAMRSVVQALAKANMLPNKFVLEALNIPGAADIAQQQQQELSLAALSKLRRPR